MRVTASMSIALAVVALLATSGCGDEDGTTRDFTPADLKRLSFARGELSGLEYQGESSGLGAFSRDQRHEAEEEGDQSGTKFLGRLERLGLEADYVSQFFAASRGSELSFAESIAFLFEDEQGAEEALEVVRHGAARNVTLATGIDTPDLGEQSFGIRGEFDGFLTYSFGWRVGNVIELVTVAPSDQDAGPKSTIALAKELEARGEES